MKLIGIVLAGFFLLIVLPAISQAEYYRFVDEKGTLNITDDLKKVPEKYRTRAESFSLGDSNKGREKETREKEEREFLTVIERLESQATVEVKEEIDIVPHEQTVNPRFKYIISLAAYALALIISYTVFIRHLNRKAINMIVVILLTGALGTYLFRVQIEESHRKYLVMKKGAEMLKKKMEKNAASKAQAIKEMQEMANEESDSNQVEIPRQFDTERIE